MLWKGLSLATNSESPIVVVLSCVCPSPSAVIHAHPLITMMP